MIDRSESVSQADPKNAAERRRPAAETDDARDFAVDAARLLADSHCDDILIFDVAELSPVTKYLIIATGTSDRQIKSVGADVAELGRQRDFDKYGSDRDGSSTWVVIDLVEVMVHLFEPATRAHYDLEMMWGDAPQVDWRRGSRRP